MFDFFLIKRVQLLALVLLCLIIGVWGVYNLFTPYTRPVSSEEVVFYSENDKRIKKTVYVRAKVLQINNDIAKLEVLDGLHKTKIINAHTAGYSVALDDVVILPQKGNQVPAATVSGVWRLPQVAVIIAVLIFLAVAVNGKRGLTALAGLLLSAIVIIWYVIPSLLDGGNALFVCGMGSFIIATISILMAHGLRKTTIISLLCIYVLLAATLLIASVVTSYVRLTGVYDETTVYLSSDNTKNIDLYGALIGGTIIATLGVLDDIVITQVAAVLELGKKVQNKRRKMIGLFRRGMVVGSEHITALINTLALAYVGVALPTLLAYASYEKKYVLHFINSEFIMQEVVRTVVSSMALILAVPLSTLVAAVFVTHHKQLFAIINKYKPKKEG